jgi:bifunctional enzyme CysN/CysC
VDLSRRELVRLATAGSVDDGKSTLIGRLLYDSKALLEDQLAALERASADRGLDHLELALITDGLRAERDQGITIDVAYRYFATPRRTFILADTPGHVQYTRNMVTGASGADVGLILVDVRRGLVEQSRRHTFLASLMRLPHLVVCVNKMDLVGWDQEAFQAVRDDFTRFAARLEVPDLAFLPMSALHGDNVVSRSDNLGWYEGAPLLRHLEEVHVASDTNLVDLRFPVQVVIRPRTASHPDYRGYAGRLASGVVRVGDEVVILPSETTSTVAGIDLGGASLEQAFAPMSVALRLSDQLDVGRGDLICRAHNRPQVTREVEAMVCWLDSSRLAAGSRWFLKHTSRTVGAVVEEVRYRFDVNTLHRDTDAGSLGLNDIGRVSLRLGAPVMVDPYRRNRTTGSFILIDEATNATAGAGMVLG